MKDSERLVGIGQGAESDLEGRQCELPHPHNLYHQERRSFNGQNHKGKDGQS